MKPPKYTARKGQSLAGFVRVNLAAIEQEQVAGISLDAIKADIAKETGIALSVESLKVAIWRARKRQAPTNGRAETEALQLHAEAKQSSGIAPRLPLKPELEAEPTSTSEQTKRLIPREPKKAFQYTALDPRDDLSHILGTPKPKGSK